MSTRAVIAIPTATGWKGRYCHQSGYPSYVGVDLQKLINRDGYNAVVSTLITGPHYGWSTLDPVVSAGTVLGPGMDDGRFTVVPGYGVAYTSVRIKGMESFTPQITEKEWISNDGDDLGTEWAYVLGETSIVVYVNAFDSWTGDNFVKHWRLAGYVRYDDADGALAMSAVEEIEAARQEAEALAEQAKENAS